MALTEREALTEKDRLFRELHEANGESYTARRIDSPEEVDPLYVAEDRHGGFDINSVADEDHNALVSVVGKTTAKRIQKRFEIMGASTPTPSCWLGCPIWPASPPGFGNSCGSMGSLARAVCPSTPPASVSWIGRA